MVVGHDDTLLSAYVGLIATLTSKLKVFWGFRGLMNTEGENLKASIRRKGFHFQKIKNKKINN